MPGNNFSKLLFADDTLITGYDYILDRYLVRNTHRIHNNERRNFYGVYGRVEIILSKNFALTEFKLRVMLHCD